MIKIFNIDKMEQVNKNIKTGKPVMILENSSHTLNRIDEGANGKSNKIILEGIFAEFGKMNRNGRIYLKDDYLPHMEMLQEDINAGNLLGELDHPADRCEVSLSNASHRILELRYDPQNDCVIGKIELLATPKGEIARKLYEAGVPLSISSRASGQVLENSNVVMDRLFTYDIVAKPGFASAQLHDGKINESVENNLIANLLESIENSRKPKYNGKITQLNENVSIVDLSNKMPVDVPMDTSHIIDTDALQQWTEDINAYVIDGVNTNKADIAGILSYLDELRVVQENTLNWCSSISQTINQILDILSPKTTLLNNSKVIPMREHKYLKEYYDDLDDRLDTRFEDEYIKKSRKFRPEYSDKKEFKSSVRKDKAVMYGNEYDELDESSLDIINAFVDEVNRDKSILKYFKSLGIKPHYVEDIVYNYLMSDRKDSLYESPFLQILQKLGINDDESKNIYKMLDTIKNRINI